MINEEIKLKIAEKQRFNRYRRICTKVNASIFDSALSQTRRSDASEKKEKKILASTLVQICLWTRFESSLVSVKDFKRVISQ